MRLSKRIKKQIADWALHSLYRMNAKTADCYAFNLCYNSKGKLDFDGGWDWQNNVIDKNVSHLFILSTQEFVKL